MALFTTAQAGNVDAGATFVGGVPPNLAGGDTIRVLHPLAINVNASFGAAATAPESLAVQAEDAPVTVNAGARLTLRGSCFLNGTASLIIGQAGIGGGKLWFDSNGVVGTPNYFVAIGCANGQSAKVFARGIAGDKSEILSVAGGGNGYFGSTNAIGNPATNDRLQSGAFDLRMAKFLRIGTATIQAFHPARNAPGEQLLHIEDCEFESCGDIITVYQIQANTEVQLLRTRFIKGLAGFHYRVNLDGSTAPTAVRNFIGNSFYLSPVLPLWGATVEGSTFLDGWQYVQAHGPSVSNRNNVIRLSLTPDLVRGGAWGDTAETEESDGGNYVCTDKSTLDIDVGNYSAKIVFNNPHWLARLGAGNGTFPMRNCIIEDFWSSGDGDIDYSSNPIGTHTRMWRVLVLPSQGDDGLGHRLNAGTLSTNNGWNGQNDEYERCTFYSGGQGPFAVAEAGVGHLHQIGKYLNCIIWNDPHYSASAYNFMAYRPIGGAGMTTDTINPAFCDGNVGWNVRNDANDLGSNTNQHYDVPFSATVGVNDLYVDPEFADPYKGFNDWVEGVCGGVHPLTPTPDRFDWNSWGIYQLSLRPVPDHPDYDAAFTLASLKAFLRNAYRPTNELLRDSGVGGVTRGAVDMAEAGGQTAETPVGTLSLLGTEGGTANSNETPAGALALAGTEGGTAHSAETTVGTLVLVGTSLEAATDAETEVGALALNGTEVDGGDEAPSAETPPGLLVLASPGLVEPVSAYYVCGTLTLDGVVGSLELAGCC